MEQKKTTFSIKNWSEDDRPREKLLHKGQTALSDAELIAILLGSGSREETAVDLSKRLLADCENSLGELGKMSLKQLMQYKGIGEAKAITIAAAMELGRRRRALEAVKRNKITSSKEVYELMQPLIGELPHEEFWMLCLNNSNKVIKKQQLSKGGITATVVDIRLAMKIAIEENATAIILVHNHPSGVLKASEPDVALTRKFVSAATSLDIKLLDHVIVTENAYFSFQDQCML